MFKDTNVDHRTWYYSTVYKCFLNANDLTMSKSNNYEKHLLLRQNIHDAEASTNTQLSGVTDNNI